MYGKLVRFLLDSSGNFSLLSGVTAKDNQFTLNHIDEFTSDHIELRFEMKNSSESSQILYVCGAFPIQGSTGCNMVIYTPYNDCPPNVEYLAVVLQISRNVLLECFPNGSSKEKMLLLRANDGAVLHLADGDIFTLTIAGQKTTFIAARSQSELSLAQFL